MTRHFLLLLLCCFSSAVAYDTLTLTYTVVFTTRGADGNPTRTSFLSTEPFTIIPTNQAVIEPAGNDRVVIGQPYTIRWNTKPIIENRRLDIFLLYENSRTPLKKSKRSLPNDHMTQVYYGTPAQNISNTGEVVWTPDVGLDERNDYHLKINYQGDSAINVGPVFGLTRGAAVANTPKPDGDSASDDTSDSSDNNSGSSSGSSAGSSDGTSAETGSAGSQATGANPSIPTTPGPMATPPGSSSKKTNTTAMVGGVVGGVLGLIIIGLCAFLCIIGRRNGWFSPKRANPQAFGDAPPQPPPPVTAAAVQRPPVHEMPSPTAGGPGYSNKYFAELEGKQTPHQMPGDDYKPAGEFKDASELGDQRQMGTQYTPGHNVSQGARYETQGM